MSNNIPSFVPAAAVHAYASMNNHISNDLTSVLPANTDEIVDHFANITNDEVNTLCQAYGQFANVTIVGCPCGQCPLFLRF